MQKTTDLPDGSSLIHQFEEMSPDKRPQDSRRSGSTLHFAVLEHDGRDLCPEAILVTDADGRSCAYRVEQEFTPDMARPQDHHQDGTDLKFEVLAHGGESVSTSWNLSRFVRPSKQTPINC
jgi:hypothetical protein